MVRERCAKRRHDSATEGRARRKQFFSLRVSRHTRPRTVQGVRAAAKFVRRDLDISLRANQEALTDQAGETLAVCLTSLESLSALSLSRHFTRGVDLTRQQLVERRAIVHPSTRKHRGDTMRVGDVREGIAGQQDKVGELAGRDRA